MMLARKSTWKSGKGASPDWLEGLGRLLNETYKSQCDQNGRYLDVYGQVYPSELLLVVTYLSEKEPTDTPISCFLSCEPEQIADEKSLIETQKNYIDLVGLFFDEIFAQEDWDEFEPSWQEVSYKNQTYYYKISRENIALTLKANELLGEDFDEDELN